VIIAIGMYSNQDLVEFRKKGTLFAFLGIRVTNKIINIFRVK